MAKAWMPLYWGDYFCKTSELTQSGHGAYMMLIGHYWETGKPIPKKNRWVITKAFSDEEREKCDEVCDLFFVNQDGLLYNNRVEVELAKSKAITEKNQKNGQKGGRPEKPKQNPEITQAKPKAFENETQIKASRAQSQSQSQSQLSSLHSDNTPLPPQGGEAHPDFEKFWEIYPKHRSKPVAEKAWNKLKPNNQLWAKILEAINVQKGSNDWKKDGGKYIPYPATWLNGRMWEDDTSNEKPRKTKERLIQDILEASLVKRIDTGEYFKGSDLDYLPAPRLVFLVRGTNIAFEYGVVRICEPIKEPC